MKAFDRLPLLARFFIVGLVVACVRALVAGARAYLGWLPGGLLGIVLFAASVGMALLVVAGVVSGVVTGRTARAFREGQARDGPAGDEEVARRALLARLAVDLRQLTEVRALRD